MQKISHKKNKYITEIELKKNKLLQLIHTVDLFKHFFYF